MINFEKMLNMRGIGGYNTKYGRKTSNKNFIRSDVPYLLTSDEIEELLNFGITTVIDFRGEQEIIKKPCVLKGVKGIEYYNIPMLGGDKYPKSEELVAPGYFAMAEDEKTIYKIMKIIAESERGVLYHCSAGKDRTGVITALLLSLAGVEKTDIAEDYFVSAKNIKCLIDEVLEKNPHLRLIENRREYIEDFLDMVEGKYGSTEGYLSKIGLHDSEIEKIKEKIFEE